MESESGGNFLELTAAIVSAYVSNNSVPAADLPILIDNIHSALVKATSGKPEMPTDPEPEVPANPFPNNPPGLPDAPTL